MDDITRQLRESCFCEGRGCELCRAADEIDRLRAELATTAEEFRRAVDALVTLRAELAELRKPDCFRCAYWFACRTLIKDDCGGGDKFVPKRDPVRLYEKEGKV